MLPGHQILKTLERGSIATATSATECALRDREGRGEGGDEDGGDVGGQEAAEMAETAREEAMRMVMGDEMMCTPGRVATRRASCGAPFAFDVGGNSCGDFGGFTSHVRREGELTRFSLLACLLDGERAANFSLKHAVV